ncbi:terpene cyclase/mutase family protein [Roseiconus nitratireducens]|uniref:Terpene cyclase/mutase family protein n=1 Tax=Roseiconus nitratireducens TaxID=2605748 RepID=A0A5M6CZM6_9BACT|nr:prenyltransferase/squalene oxidase repeat-containing protein [Roseiconus nitratireducens]KAA5540681.1 terpene cyclase/mutase family protein [Roseiconus nitratireducens]
MSLESLFARVVSPLALGSAVVVAACSAPGALAQEKASIELNSPEQTNAAIDRSVAEGISFLKNRGQGDDGAFSPETGVAVTGIAVRAILQNRPEELKSPPVQKAIEYILEHVQPDGGIYARGSTHRNYETSVAVGALVAAQQDNEYESQLTRAEAFLKGLQWDEGEGVESSDPAYGGAGYGSHSRPDLSNTSFMLDALRDLGNGSDDEAVQKALRFISRTQNLSGHGNDTPHADKINDGGFYYTPAAGGETKVVSDSDDDGGGLRSYGSMTYAGLKSMIYAGLTQDDPRVRAAMEFIEKTYSLSENPGMGQAGLYYYYHTFAKALDAAEVQAVTDGQGNVHDWNRELARTLIAAQQSDGSWVNDGNERWMEGNRNLVTAYALLALDYCRE